MKKKEEEMEFQLDDTIETTRVEVPKQEVSKRTRKEAIIADASEKAPVVSCLRNERIVVRKISKPTALVSNPRHALYGGMAETATRTFVTPMLSSGAYKNVLTDNEKVFLEEIMGLEYNTLSVYKKENNYWSSNNPAANVSLSKQDNYLDLSDPEQYIKYKILLANKDYIAPSLEELEDHPKATYQFVIISEGEETKTAKVKLSTKKQCYKELGRIDGDIDTLRVIIETIDGRPTAPTAKLEFLETKADELITNDSKTFLRVITDPMLSTKVLIKKSLEAGLIGKKGEGYYLKDGTPLCELNEDPTLNVAARFLNMAKHQEVKFMLEAKLKE
jgi:hypothetical protein